jgi:tetratricopeptide (TPR) repeat protein
MKAFQGQRDWKGLEAAALEETKLKTGTPDAWQYVVIARMRMGNAPGAEEAIAKFKEKAAGSQGVELEVWSQIFLKKVTEATLETVQKQDGPKQIHDSYLVALVDLAMKKTEETQEALKQAIGNDDAETMDARGWVIYGGICDQYGFPDAAAAAWQKAKVAKAVTRESEWALATLGR